MYGDANIVSNLLNINVIEKITTQKMQYHLEIKKGLYKFEAFVFDGFKRAAVENAGQMRFGDADEHVGSGVAYAVQHFFFAHAGVEHDRQRAQFEESIGGGDQFRTGFEEYQSLMSRFHSGLLHG